MHNYIDSGDGETCFRKVDEYCENTLIQLQYRRTDVQIVQHSGYDLVCNVCSAYTIRENFTLITSYHAKIFETVLYAIV